MHNKSVKELVLSGFFIALGLVTPMFFHALGAGSTFLPMHIPVLIAGFVLGLPFSLAVGAITPMLSSLLTGMPPAFPIMPYMAVELAVYGASASLLHRKLRFNIFISLIGSMIMGRLAAAAAVWVLTSFFTAALPGPVVFVAGAVVQGIPGILIQLVFIPAIVYALEKSRLIEKEGTSF